MVNRSPAQIEAAQLAFKWRRAKVYSPSITMNHQCFLLMYTLYAFHYTKKKNEPITEEGDNDSTECVYDSDEAGRRVAETAEGRGCLADPMRGVSALGHAKDRGGRLG